VKNVKQVSKGIKQSKWMGENEITWELKGKKMRDISNMDIEGLPPHPVSLKPRSLDWGC